MNSELLLEQGLQLTDKIGEGSFGQVYHGFYHQKEVAVKVFSNQLQETNIMESLYHPSIIQFVKYLKFSSKHYLVMEYARGGSLNELMTSSLNEDQASLLMRQLLEAVDYLHSQCIIHRDIKPDNILLKRPQDLHSLKLADFGLSYQYHSELRHTVSQKCGTFIFMAPEQIQNQPYNQKVDLWSCGVVMYMLLSGGRHPYYPRLNTRQKVLDQLPDLVIDQIENISFLAKDLLRRLLCVDRSLRYNAMSALAHPWITRRFKDSIPMSLQEQGQTHELWDKMILRIKFFMTIFAIRQQSPKAESPIASQKDSESLVIYKRQATYTDFGETETEEDPILHQSSRIINLTSPNIPMHRGSFKGQTLKPVIIKNSQKLLSQLHQPSQSFKSCQLNAILSNGDRSPKKTIMKPQKYSIDQQHINLEQKIQGFSSISPVKGSIEKASVEGSDSPTSKLKLNRSKNKIMLPLLSDSTQASLSPVKGVNKRGLPVLRKSQSTFFLGLTKFGSDLDMNKTSFRERIEEKNQESTSISHRRLNHIDSIVSPKAKRDIIKSILESNPQKPSLYLPKPQAFRFRHQKNN